MMEAAQTSGTPFSLVVLDARMPGMDGFALAERIRCSRELAKARIMMLTSDRQPGDIARCRELGIAVHLVKPVGQSDLLNAIKVALGLHKTVTDRTTDEVSASLEPDAPKLRLLLAEDNLVNQRLVIRLLEKRGHEVVVANNGKEALRLLDESGGPPFDAVLMDVQMPEMDGYEATAAIRSKDEVSGNHTPIIAMTAHAMTGDSERCLEAGMDGYVSKPIRIEHLIGELRRCARTSPSVKL